MEFGQQYVNEESPVIKEQLAKAGMRLEPALAMTSRPAKQLFCPVVLALSPSVPFVPPPFFGELPKIRREYEILSKPSGCSPL
jgi:hypothetical protein